MAEDIKTKPVTNVPVVDKKKALDRDVGVEMEREADEAIERYDKLKSAESEQKQQIEQFYKEQQDFKLNRKITDASHIAPFDPTGVPDYAYTHEGRRVRFKDPDYIYRWVRHVGRAPSRMSHQRVKGYEPVYWDDKVKGTELEEAWQRIGAEGFILNGDCVLMRIPQRKYDALTARKKRIQELWTRAAEEKFDDEGARLGVDTYRQGPTGRKEFR